MRVGRWGAHYRGVTALGTVIAVTSALPASVATAVLLVALEPAAPRSRLEAALVLLGHRVEAIDESVARGLVRATGDRFEVLDARMARVVAQGAADHERRVAHLALACSRARRTVGYDARSVFDSLSAALDGSVPLPDEALGAPRRTERIPLPLTPRERAVADLAACGLPTREIAMASYLSQETVEYHLTRVYRKLGVRSKSELVFALGGRPAPTGH
jgi:DNA-binding NarL/FixJ family response regulator